MSNSSRKVRIFIQKKIIPTAFDLLVLLWCDWLVHGCFYELFIDEPHRLEFDMSLEGFMIKTIEINFNPDVNTVAYSILIVLSIICASSSLLLIGWRLFKTQQPENIKYRNTQLVSLALTLIGSFTVLIAAAFNSINDFIKSRPTLE